MKNFCSLLMLVGLLSGALPAQAAGTRIPRSPSSVGRFDWNMARKLFKKVHPRNRQELEHSLKYSQARADYRAIAEDAAELCFFGDRTGKACADAERYGGNLQRRAVFVVLQ